MNRSPAVHPARLSALALALALGGCSSVGSLFSSDKVDYRSAAAETKPRALEVPPDLTQLARDNRYQTQGGVVSAAATPALPGIAAATAAPAAAAATVAPLDVGGVHVERDGNQRWLVVPMSPEQLWPQLEAFWRARGLKLASENPTTGVMETEWAENRAKLPQDVIRGTIGKLLDNVYDTGQRDLYRTRVERTATGSEVYISHRGMEEVYTSELKDSTVWQPRPPDPQLEAEMLSLLMVQLGTKPEAARAAVAAAPETPGLARAVAGGTGLEVDEGFDRTWRRVGLALDRTGFTVEDRDRAAGLYFVRYVDPKNVGKEEPGWWARLFGAKTDLGLERYRIAVKGSGNKTAVTVLAGDGSAASGETAKRIVDTLVKELR